ncbi:KdsC family phosphatase [Nitrosopumilus sp.]|uniref:KdsC family phosphatase n=1 Tax=Nitrosopumilus sp. TaxID=2024843 RepID=UPI003D0FCA06
MNKVKKAKNIKILLTDVDGVLTDGGMYYTIKGDQMKKFHTRDGMGVTLLRKNEIPTIIVTKEKTIMVKKWAKKMKIEQLYESIQNKEEVLEEVCKKYKINSDQVAYIGDDINDIGLLKKVGFSASPKDAINQVQKIVDYVCGKKGGEGAFREVADLLIQNNS